MDGTDVAYSEKTAVEHPEPEPVKPTAPAGTWQARQQQAQARLQGMFQQAAADVRVRASQLEANVIKPSAAYATQLSQRRPLLFTFLSIFTILSLPPLFTFLAFSLLSTLIIFSTALFLSLLVLGCLLTGAFALLLGALALACGTAMGLTVAMVGGWVALSLLGHVRTHGVRDGTGAWVGELRYRAGGGAYPNK